MSRKVMEMSSEFVNISLNYIEISMNSLDISIVCELRLFNMGRDISMNSLDISMHSLHFNEMSNSMRCLEA